MKPKSSLLGACLLLTALSSNYKVNGAFAALRSFSCEVPSNVSAVAKAMRYVGPMVQGRRINFRSVANTALPTAPKVTLISGDGIGPEVTATVLDVFKAAGVPVEWEFCEAGAKTFNQGDATGVPASTIESIKRNRVALKGPLETPVGYGGKSANVTLRKMLNLYGNIRPVRRIPGIQGPYQEVPIDFTVVRENAEDLYTGIEHMQTPDVAQTLKLVSRWGCEKIIRLAFALAEAEGRSKVTCATKANIMKLTEGMMKRVFEEVALEFPHLQSEHMIVDNCAHQMVKKPQQFDVVVMTNMNGDILSDEASALVGGLGIAPGVNYGDEVAVFEAVHGSAPDIAGQNKANPTATLLSSVMMLRHLGMFEAADLIENAMYVTIADGKYLTWDIARAFPAGSTNQFKDAIIHNLGKKYPAWLRREQRRLEITPPKRREQEIRQKTVGMDVFIHSPERALILGPILERMTEGLGLRLKMIGDMGLQVYPDIGGISSRGSFHHQCRFVSEANASVTEAALLQLLERISSKARWVHIERLQDIADKPAYSKIQGEA